MRKNVFQYSQIGFETIRVIPFQLFSKKWILYLKNGTFPKKVPPSQSVNRRFYMACPRTIIFVRKIWSRLKEYHTMNPHINYRLIRVTIPFCSRRRRRRKNFKLFSKENLRSTSTCTLSTLWESQIKYQTRDYHSIRLLGKILHYPKKSPLTRGGSYLLLFIKFQNVP